MDIRRKELIRTLTFNHGMRTFDAEVSVLSEESVEKMCQDMIRRADF
jgi:hypothetical protein